MIDKQARRRRALYRATHRGTKEMDWLLGRFASLHVAGMVMDDLVRFERLLACPDADIESWIMGWRPPDDGFADLIASLRRFHEL